MTSIETCDVSNKDLESSEKTLPTKIKIVNQNLKIESNGTSDVSEEMLEAPNEEPLMILSNEASKICKDILSTDLVVEDCGLNMKNEPEKISLTKPEQMPEGLIESEDSNKISMTDPEQITEGIIESKDSHKIRMIKPEQITEELIETEDINKISMTKPEQITEGLIETEDSNKISMTEPEQITEKLTETKDSNKIILTEPVQKPEGLIESIGSKETILTEPDQKAEGLIENEDSNKISMMESEQKPEGPVESVDSKETILTEPEQITDRLIETEDSNKISITEPEVKPEGLKETNVSKETSMTESTEGLKETNVSKETSMTESTEGLKETNDSKEISSTEPEQVTQGLKETNDSKEISSTEPEHVTQGLKETNDSKEISMTEPEQMTGDLKEPDDSKEITSTEPEQMAGDLKETNDSKEITSTEPELITGDLKEPNESKEITSTEPELITRDLKEPNESREITSTEPKLITGDLKEPNESKESSVTKPIEMNESSAETESELNKTAEHSEGTPVFLQLFDDKFGMTCEIKTDNLDMLEVEKLSKELCGTEFIVEMGEPVADPPVCPNALLTECTGAETAESSNAVTPDAQSSSTGEGLAKTPKRSKLLSKPVADKVKRSSLPNLKAAIGRQKLKPAGTQRKLVGGARKMVPVKRAKSLGNVAKSPAKSPAATPKRKKSVPDVAFDTDLLKVALLQHGWFRELVHRRTSTPQKKEGDIYYFTPEPERKKYRSRLEIVRMLPKNSPLKAEHFSFSRKLIGLGPEYERERNALTGQGSPAPAPGKVRPKKTPVKSKLSSPAKKGPSPKKTPAVTPGSKRVPKKSAKLLAQEETDKENEAVPRPSVEPALPSKARIGRPPKTPVVAGGKTSQKKSTEIENQDTTTTGKSKRKSKLLLEEKTETPKRRKSAKPAKSDGETTPELLNDDLSGAKSDRFPRIKLKISNGQSEKTPVREKPHKRASIVLKEKNNGAPPGSSEKAKRIVPPVEAAGKVSAKKESKQKKEPPAGRSLRVSAQTPEVEKKKPDSDKKVKAATKDKPSPKSSTSCDDLFGRKVPPISLTITKSPQKTIVSIKKSSDGKRPEIQVEIRKPNKGDESRTGEKKAEAKKPEVTDTSDDGTLEGKPKGFFESMKTRKRGGFTLSKEECEIISGAKRTKSSPAKPITPPGITNEEVDRLSSVKVMLSPCRQTGKDAPGAETNKKRKAAKTLEAEFDRIDKELLTAPPKRKRQASPTVKSSRGKAGETDGRLSVGKKTGEAGAVVKTKEKTEAKTKAETKRKSKERKENVIVNGGAKENLRENRKAGSLVSPPASVLPDSTASRVSSLFSDASQNSPMYRFLVSLLSYLTVQDRLRAARVNKLFHLAAQHASLWSHVRMKNSRVADWTGLASALSSHGTLSLDMKKMLTPADPQRQLTLWSDLPTHLSRVESLRTLDMGKCSSHVFENMKGQLVHLETLSATLHRGQSVVLSHFNSMINLTKLKLKGYEIKKGAQNIFGLSNLSKLTHLRHLALTSVGNLNQASLEAITASCPRLRCLELGSCASLTSAALLSRLSSLEKLRLEIVVKEASVPILETVASLPSLVHLELINVDVPKGFDDALGRCTRVRTLIIIPTYVSQSALTNYLLLSGIGKLQQTLRLVSWGLTMELLQVTDMFAAKWRGSTQFKSDGTCVPVMSPIPACYLEEPVTNTLKNPEVDLFPISKLKKLLAGHMRTSGVSIFTVSYSNTLRHTMMK